MSKKLLNATCTVQHTVYLNTGRVVSSSDVNVPIRRVTRRKFLKTASGDQEIYEDVLYFAYDAVISKTDEILLGGVTRRIKAFISARDGLDNIHHYEAVLQ